MYTCIHTYAYICTYVCIHMYLCMYVTIHMYIYVLHTINDHKCICCYHLWICVDHYCTFILCVTIIFLIDHKIICVNCCTVYNGRFDFCSPQLCIIIDSCPEYFHSTSYASYCYYTTLQH